LKGCRWFATLLQNGKLESSVGEKPCAGRACGYGRTGCTLRGELEISTRVNGEVGYVMMRTGFEPERSRAGARVLGDRIRILASRGVACAGWC
jgi:hypothetical protein